MKPTNLSRRQLLRGLGALGASSAAAPWLMNLAAMAPARAANAKRNRAMTALLLTLASPEYIVQK